jgi:hypothetical protein
MVKGKEQICLRSGGEGLKRGEGVEEGGGATPFIIATGIPLMNWTCAVNH